MSEIKALHEQCKLINAETQLGVVEAEFWTTDTGALEFRTRGPANTGIWIDWGDGSGEWIEHIGTGSDVTTTHTYTITGKKPLKFSGILSSVTYFRCVDASFGGDVGTFSVFSSLTDLLLNDTGIKGNMSVVSGLSSLVNLSFYNTGISGALSSISSLQSLATLNLSFASSITGTIADISPVTTLTQVRISNVSLTGDFGDFDTLVSATYIAAENNTLSYTTTTLPAWSNAQIYPANNAMTQTEVDNFLIDLDAAGGTNGTLNIGGTNSAPSSAAIAAINSLIGKGWDLTITTGAELLADGDMEAVGVAAWTAGNSATLTKDVTDPHGGAQCLRVAHGGTANPYAHDPALYTIGKHYLVTGWARSDGTGIPWVATGSTTQWTGSTSTSWQKFEFAFTADHPWFVLWNRITVAGHCEFDDCSVKEII